MNMHDFGQAIREIQNGYYNEFNQMHADYLSAVDDLHQKTRAKLAALFSEFTGDDREVAIQPKADFR